MLHLHLYGSVLANQRLVKVLQIICKFGLQIVVTQLCSSYISVKP